jgi:hypothetical protein
MYRTIRQQFAEGSYSYQQIVGARKYDTATASPVIELWIDDFPDNDWHCDWCEILFENLHGQFFVYRYCDAGDPWDYDKITPMNREEAILWAEKHRSAQTLEDIFGKIKEAGEP